MEANYIFYVKLLVELREKTTMRKTQAMNLKGLSSSCCRHSALMQLRPLYYLVSDQVSMQQASKIVENVPPKISIYYSDTTHSWSEEKFIIQQCIIKYLSATN